MYMDQDLPSASCVENYRQNTNPQDLETKKIFGEIEEIEDEVERRFNRFKNFDVISHPPYDHRFLTSKHYDTKKIVSGSSFSRRIEQEWSLLDKNIPSSIFIRSYEQRIDLMRATIIGPPGSPYHHCLFFFDIIFPRNYPSTPPKLHYHSYGIDLNPNLRLDGRVCLTLLETWYERLKQNWHGSNNREKWNPKESNLLHVLHAIQNLISPQSPEPSCFYLYDKSEPLKNYNRRAFMLTCEKMIRILREPPMDFEGFVEGHFRKRAHPVLLKFKENKYDSEFMIDLFVSLFKVFERNGAYCMHHLDFLRSIKQQTTTADAEARIRNLEGHQ
ncbi:hypothetical protein Pfo_006043 [Paulownia fortunei]|nr:hypothetical protein Pfo_006043 [Paulownia fortunei]